MADCSPSKWVKFRRQAEDNSVRHYDAAANFITGMVSDQTKSPSVQALHFLICGWPLSHRRKRWSKLSDSKLCRHSFSPQNGSMLPPYAGSPVALATESLSPTTQDTIRLIVRGSLGSCSSSSECKSTHKSLSESLFYKKDHSPKHDCAWIIEIWYFS